MNQDVDDLIDDGELEAMFTEEEEEEEMESSKKGKKKNTKKKQKNATKVFEFSDESAFSRILTMSNCILLF